MTPFDARSPRLARRLEQRVGAGGKLLLTFLTAGYPDLATSQAILTGLAGAGEVDILEIGVPFSDPLADGPTIQAASNQALAAGMRMKDVFQLAAAVRRAAPDLPTVLMGYLNPFLALGPERLVAAARGAGVDGFIIPDLLPGGEPALEAALAEGGFDRIQMLAPTTRPERMRWVDRQASGFLYTVAVTGVTGARSALPEGLDGFCGRVRQETTHPFIVGFGISSPKTAAAAARSSDGVVVGSALIDQVAMAVAQDRDPVEAALAFTRSLRQALPCHAP